MLQMAYTDPVIAARDIQALTDLVAAAIPIETFILYTVLTLRENDMVTNNPSPPYCPYDSMTQRVLTPNDMPASPPSSGQLRGRPITPTLRYTAHRRVATTCGTTPQLETSYSSLSTTLRRYCHRHSTSRLAHSDPPSIVRVHPLDIAPITLQALL